MLFLNIYSSITRSFEINCVVGYIHLRKNMPNAYFYVFNLFVFLEEYSNWTFLFCTVCTKNYIIYR